MESVLFQEQAAAALQQHSGGGASTPSSPQALLSAVEDRGVTQPGGGAKGEDAQVYHFTFSCNLHVKRQEAQLDKYQQMCLLVQSFLFPLLND